MSTPVAARSSRESIKARQSAREQRTRGGSRGPRGRLVQQSSARSVASSANGGSGFQTYQKSSSNSNEHHNDARIRNGTSPIPNGVQVSSAILSHAGRISMPQDQAWRNAAEQDNITYKQRMSDLYQKLKEKRERERKQAIKDGFLADPDKPRSLAHAITPVGTCQDMCPEYERVERIVQLMVDANEKVPSISDAGTKVPCEELMVKRFRRSAAGYDEQLPSDIRPPRVLQKTLNHLFESVIGGPEPLANTHKFVWDRTRGIRNDFSIQQVSKIDDLKIAIDCFERIARFHILSLHQLSHPSRDNGEFDHHQEREQLNNTLLSLMYYYDDSRRQLVSPNEAEFRAYCIIFEMQDQRPDLEDRAQNWPITILEDPRVKTALKLYAAAGNTSDEQGPLRPRTTFSTAQANTRGFFDLVQSNSVSYIMACVAEIYFNLVRSTALEAIWTAYRKRRPGSVAVDDWGVEDLTYALGLDYHDQTREFCEEHGFEIGQREHGEDFLNLGSVTGRILIDHNPRRKQIFSKYIVESKRLKRAFPAVIDGLSFLDAKAQGLVNASDTESLSSEHSESLFITGDSDGDRRQQRSRSRSPHSKAFKTSINQPSNVNGATTTFNPFSNTERHSNEPNPFDVPRPAPENPISTFATFPRPSTTSRDVEILPPTDPRKSNFSGTSNQERAVTTFSPSNFGSGGMPKFDFTKPSSPQPATQNPSSTIPGNIGAPMFDFTAPSSQQKSSTTTTSSMFGSGEAPKFDFRSAAHAKKADDKKAGGFGLTNGGPAPSASSSFGTPSVKSSTKISPESTSQSPFVFGTPTSVPSKTITSEPSSTSNQPREGLEPQLGSTKSQSAAKSSEEASKFASAITWPVKSSTNDSWSFERPEVSSSTIPAITLQAPDQVNSSSGDSLANKASNGLAGASKASTKQFPDFVSQSTMTNNPPPFNFLNPNMSGSPRSAQEKVELISTAPDVPPVSSFFPSSLDSSPQKQPRTMASTSASASTTNTLQSSTFGISQPKPVAFAIPPPDPRPAALDKLTDGLMFDDGGLLQQYVEITIDPIINSAIAQFRNEESWRIARECRLVLLSKKYLRRWKKMAWSIGVMRRGRKQRQRFSQSIQNRAEITKGRAHGVGRSSIFDVERARKGTQEPMTRKDEFPSSGALSSQKRQSLPAETRAESAIGTQTPKSTKRKLDQSESPDDGRKTRPHVSGHKRSHTVGSSLNANISSSAPPHPHSQPSRNSNIWTLPDESISNDSIIRQARRIATTLHSDTTNTDYFRLKALGVNPDTPIVPLTKGRAITREGDRGAFKFPDKPARAVHDKSQLPDQRSNNELKTNAPSSKDDEELFASLRAIRSTLAESTAWFQSERENIERSMTPSRTSKSPSSSKQETPAERRLREFREKGHTPSRSEVRMRAMGDKSLLPASFWDGERQEGSNRGGLKSKRKSDDWRNGEELQRGQKRRGMASESTGIGFAALVNQQSPQNGMVTHEGLGNGWPYSDGVNGFGQHGSEQPGQSQQANGGNDDVIELSD